MTVIPPFLVIFLQTTFLELFQKSNVQTFEPIRFFMLLAKKRSRNGHKMVIYEYQILGISICLELLVVLGLDPLTLIRA